MNKYEEALNVVLTQETISDETDLRDYPKELYEAITKENSDKVC